VIAVLLKHIKNPEKKNTNPNVIGKKIFQPIPINWSKRNRGKFARTKINKNVIIITLNPNNKDSNILESTKLYDQSEIPDPPPKKKIINKQLINKILAYSPKKKAANKKSRILNVVTCY